MQVAAGLTSKANNSEEANQEERAAGVDKGRGQGNRVALSCCTSLAPGPDQGGPMLCSCPHYFGMGWGLVPKNLCGSCLLVLGASRGPTLLLSPLEARTRLTLVPRPEASEGC